LFAERTGRYEKHEMKAKSWMRMARVEGWGDCADMPGSCHDERTCLREKKISTDY
jgi:hypothetical protein